MISSALAGAEDATAVTVVANANVTALRKMRTGKDESAVCMAWEGIIIAW
jgi:hypothetical protein